MWPLSLSFCSAVYWFVRKHSVGFCINMLRPPLLWLRQPVSSLPGNPGVSPAARVGVASSPGHLRGSAWACLADAGPAPVRGDTAGSLVFPPRRCVSGVPSPVTGGRLHPVGPKSWLSSPQPVTSCPSASLGPPPTLVLPWVSFPSRPKQAPGDDRPAQRPQFLLDVPDWWACHPGQCRAVSDPHVDLWALFAARVKERFRGSGAPV